MELSCSSRHCLIPPEPAVERGICKTELTADELEVALPEGFDRAMLTNGEPERERPEQRSRIKLPSPFDKSRSASQLAQSFFGKDPHESIFNHRIRGFGKPFSRILSGRLSISRQFSRNSVCAHPHESGERCIRKNTIHPSIEFLLIRLGEPCFSISKLSHCASVCQ